MIGYHVGGWFYMAAIFCGIVGGLRSFEMFAGVGTLVLIGSLGWEMMK